MKDFLDRMLDEQEREYAERDKALGPMSKSEAEKEAEFLRGWSKYKPIRRMHSAADLCNCGRWSTKVPRRTAEALIREGLATGTPDSFTMVKAAKR